MVMMNEKTGVRGGATTSGVLLARATVLSATRAVAGNAVGIQRRAILSSVRQGGETAAHMNRPAFLIGSVGGKPFAVEIVGSVDPILARPRDGQRPGVDPEAAGRLHGRAGNHQCLDRL